MAKIAGRIQLGEMLRLGYGEESQGGRKKASILADALEALIAAVFLDSDYDRTKKFVSDIFEETIKEKIVMKKDDNYKSELQEISASRPLSSSVFGTTMDLTFLMILLLV